MESEKTREREVTVNHVRALSSERPKVNLVYRRVLLKHFFHFKGRNELAAAVDHLSHAFVAEHEQGPALACRTP